mmetsp:Transcript_41137/g.99130  ORF Transcript_41137/g.99130 Transcript_41137/m.99130 type:complete len:450 (+) Transcript_41137:642-1991(+)
MHGVTRIDHIGQTLEVDQLTEVFTWRCLVTGFQFHLEILTGLTIPCGSVPVGPIHGLPSCAGPSSETLLSSVLGTPDGKSKGLQDESSKPRVHGLVTSTRQDHGVGSWRSSPLGCTLADIGLEHISICHFGIGKASHVWTIQHDHVAAPFHLVVGSIAVDNLTQFPDRKVRKGGIQFTISMGLFKVFVASDGVDGLGDVKVTDTSTQLQGTSQSNLLVDREELILFIFIIVIISQALDIDTHGFGVFVLSSTTVAQHFLHQCGIIEETLQQVLVLVAILGKLGEDTRSCLGNNGTLDKLVFNIRHLITVQILKDLESLSHGVLFVFGLSLGRFFSKLLGFRNLVLRSSLVFHQLVQILFIFHLVGPVLVSTVTCLLESLLILGFHLNLLLTFSLDIIQNCLKVFHAEFFYFLLFLLFLLFSWSLLLFLLLLFLFLFLLLFLLTHVALVC